MRKNCGTCGFTLIELIVVVSILTVLSTLGIAAFINYSRTQALNEAVSDVATMLQTAKSRAQSQVKPTSGACASSPLDGYRVTFSSASPTYKLEVVCGGNTLSPPIETKNLPQDIAFVNLTSEIPLLFEVLSGRVKESTSVPNAPVYIQTNVGCGNPAGLTPDQLCQREVATDSLAVAVSGTTVAKGYWWKQCGGASIGNCSGLDCTVNQLDCTNTPGSWGTQLPYPSGYLKTGNNSEVFDPDEPGYNCSGYNPGWTMRAYCSRPPTVLVLPEEVLITIRGHGKELGVAVFSDGRIVVR